MSVVACIMHFEWVVVSELRQEEMKKNKKQKWIEQLEVERNRLYRERHM